MKFKPSLTRHCFYCGVCVAHYDHHNFLLGACVTNRNYRYLFSLVVVAIWWYSLCLYLDIVELRHLYYRPDKSHAMVIDTVLHVGVNLLLTAGCLLFAISLFFYNLF